MQKLVLGTLLGASLGLSGSGCIVSSDDDDDDGVGDGGDDSSGACGASFDGILYNPTWLCPPTAVDIEIVAFPVGSAVSLTPDVFDCGEPQPPDICYDPGDYDIVVTPLGPDGEYASQFAQIRAGDGDLVEDDFEFTQDGGFFDVAWTIDGDDPAIACAEIGAVTFEIGATAQSTGDLFIHRVPCEDADTIAPDDLDGWPIDSYSVDILLADEADVAISDPPDIQGVFIDFADHLSPDLGTIDFVTF